MVYLNGEPEPRSTLSQASVMQTQLILTTDDLAKSVDDKSQTDMTLLRLFEGFQQGSTPVPSVKNFSFRH